jgi:hypothetical protein
LDLWCEKGVKPHCQGEALISRYADDCVCAFRFRSDADWLYQALPTRLAKFKLEVSPEKTRILRFSRFHPGMTRRFTFVGFEVFWTEDRQGVPRVTRRTARTKLQRACQRITAWMQANRHLPGHAFFNGLNARLRGHYRSYGVHGNSGALSRFCDWAMHCAFKWLNRRGGKRRSFSWVRFTQILDANHIERPRIIEQRRRRVFA